METYAQMFSTAMKKRWQCRAYIDLFAGPGHAIIKGSRRRVLTSPLLALTVRDPFDMYIFCEKDESFAAALAERAAAIAPSAAVSVIVGDANEEIGQVENHLPRGCISFCFVDPFGCDINLETMRRLSQRRAMDFLVLLALGMDATRNWERYLSPENDRVATFLGDQDWRSRWAEEQRTGKTPRQFLMERYSDAMATLDYLKTPVEDMHEVRLGGVRLYYLAFFSKNPLGLNFWRKAKQSAADQFELGFA